MFLNKCNTTLLIYDLVMCKLKESMISFTSFRVISES
jgi:hypothetical protein